MVLTFCLFRSSDVFNIGPGMNNTIGLSKIGRDTRVTICNNNHTILVYSVPSMKQIASLELPSAVNHSKLIQNVCCFCKISNSGLLFNGIAAVSADGKQMLATSDTGDVYRYSIRGDGYTLDSTYKGKQAKSQEKSSLCDV